jgi:inorganic triphosphatase YgiF
MSEIELKLAVASGDLAKAREILSGRGGRASAPVTLTSTYYDTAEGELHRQHLLLRVRKEGRQFVQTVKREAVGDTDLLARGEWEDAIDGERPDRTAPRSGAVLQKAAVVGELNPLFKTVVRRSTILLEPGADTRVEAALDEGEIRAADGAAVEPISEIELELKSGSPAVLYDMALRLVDAMPLRIETRSKGQRGYRLIDQQWTYPVVGWRRLRLAADMTVDAVLQGMGRRCLGVVLRNEPAARAGDAEAIHQMRVAARRLRSALAALKPMLPEEHYRWANGELKWLAGALGGARNYDVICENLLDPARNALPVALDLQPLLDAVERERRSAHEQAKDAIASTRYTASLLKLARWFEARGWRDQPVSERSARLMAGIAEVAPDLIARRYRKARQRSKNFAELGPAERHRLRIALKKLRYSVDLVRSLFTKREVSAFLDLVKPLQDDLGCINDVRVAHELFARLFRTSNSVDLDVTAGVVLGWHDRGLAENERRLRKHVRRFRDVTHFW